MESLHFRDCSFKDFYAFSFETLTDKNAPFDEDSLEEVKFLAQERVNDKLFNGLAYGILPCVFGSVPSLSVKSVAAKGNKYHFTVVWVSNQAAVDFVNGSRNEKGKAVSNPFDSQF